MTEGRFRLYQNPGWGSAIIEAQLAFYGMPVDLVEVGDLLRDDAARVAFLAVNRLGQVPVLDLPSGRRMTESAAITLHLADLAGSDALVPGPDAPERADFLRWLVFIVANIYPTFTFADVPTRFVDDDRAAARFVHQVNDYAQGLWRDMDHVAGSPWFLGRRFSALDVYLAVMVNWRPGRDWFAAEVPGLLKIAERVRRMPEPRVVFERNFPEG